MTVSLVTELKVYGILRKTEGFGETDVCPVRPPLSLN